MSHSNSRLRALLAAAVGMAVLVQPASEVDAAPGAVELDPACTTTQLTPGANAIDSAPLGFSMSFFGTTYDSVFVHEDGFVTLGAPGPLLGFPDDGLVALGLPVIAPMRLNGDRILPESEVTYGQTTVDGRPAFCALWSDLTQPPETDAFGNPGPGPFPGDPTNLFQLLIVDRADISTGNVDVIFNYEYINWAEEYQYVSEPIDPRGGWSDGNPLNPDSTFEIPGSGVPGGFYDDADGPAVTSTNSAVEGRHVFAFGDPPDEVTISGTVTESAGGLVADAPVSVCTTAGQPCTVLTTDSAGSYSVVVADGDYRVTAHGPAGTELLDEFVEPVSVAGAVSYTHLTLPTKEDECRCRWSGCL